MKLDDFNHCRKDPLRDESDQQNLWGYLQTTCNILKNTFLYNYVVFFPIDKRMSISARE